MDNARVAVGESVESFGTAVAEPSLEQWVRSFQEHDPHSDYLPPHHLGCLGCGPGNPHGHHLRAQRNGNGVVARHVFDERHMGAPGIAHGGAVATVLR